MKTVTELQIEYVYFSWSYDFPPEIEAAIESDYVANADLYDEGTLKEVAVLLLIEPDASPIYVLDLVRKSHSASQAKNTSTRD